MKELKKIKEEIEIKEKELHNLSTELGCLRKNIDFLEQNFDKLYERYQEEKEVKVKLEGVFKNLPLLSNEIIDAVGGIENIDFSNSVHNYLKCGWSGKYDYIEWKLILFDKNKFDEQKIDLCFFELKDFEWDKSSGDVEYFIFSHKRIDKDKGVK